MTEEDCETTENESVDLYDKLMEMTGWKVVDKEKENLDSCLIKFVERILSPCFVYERVEP